MTRSRARFVLCMSLLVVAVGAAPTQAGKGDTGGTAYQLEKAVVVHGPTPLTDIYGAQQDHEATYLGTEIRAGHVLNRLESSSERDQLLLDIGSTKSGRYLGFDDAAYPRRTTPKCGVARVYFVSHTKPHWFENVALGESTVGDGVLQCWKDTRMKDGWIIGYPNASSECLQLLHISTRVWQVTADTSCPSARWNVAGGVTTLDRDWGAPAPFTVTWHHKDVK